MPLLKKALEIDLYRIIPRLWRGESPAAKAAFIWALIVGFISHLFIYTGRYFGDHDMGMISVVGQIHGDYMHGHGRWLSAIMTHVNYTYILPLLSGLYVSLFLAVAAFFVCKIFNIRARISAVLVGILMVTFPSISNTNLLLYDTANYHLAALFAVLAVYVTMKYRFGFIAGGLLLMCCLAIYQAMFNVACILCLSVLLLRMLDGDFCYKKLQSESVRLLLLGASGAIFYSLSLLLNEHIFGRALSGYRGISFASVREDLSSVRGWIHALQAVYSSYMNGLLSGKIYMLMFQLKMAYLILFLLSAALLAGIIIQRKIYKQPLHLLLLALFLLLIPMASNFSNFIAASGLRAHMMYAFTFTFVLAILFLEQMPTAVPLLKTTLVACIIFIAGNWIIVNNVYYLQAWFFNQATHSATTRIVARMEEFLARSASRQVAYFGGIPNEFLTKVSNEFTELDAWYGIPLNSNEYDSYFIHMKSDNRFGHEMFVNNLRNLHGVDMDYLPFGDERAAIREQILATNMPVWPLEGSIDVIDDVIVINHGIADVVCESEGERVVFRARHYRDENLAAAEYEYHWRLFRNSALILDEVSDSDRLYIDPLKAYGRYAAWVVIKNTRADYEYPLRRLPPMTLGIPEGGSAADVLPAYLAHAQDDGHIIILSVKDEASTAFTETHAAAFHALGLSESLVDKYRYAYAAIIDGDEVLFEDISPDLISHTQSVGDVLMAVKSAGFDNGDMSSILIDDVEYSQNMRGINIVVYDKTAGAVVDAVTFDTYTAP